MRLLLVLVVVSTCVRAWSATKSSPETLVLTNVNVVDTRGGAIVPHVTVVVADHRIANIARLALISADRSVQVVNATGMYLMPGLWDMHAQTGRSPIWDERVLYPLYIANGVLGVRDLGGSDEMTERRRRRIEQGELPGPHIVSLIPNAGSRSIERLSGIWLECSSQEDELRRESLEALTKQDREAYATITERAWSSYDPRKAWNKFLQFSSSNTWQVPSLVWSQTAALPHDRDLLDANLKYVPASIRHEWEASTHTRPAQELEVMKREADREIELVSAMRRAGVQFMAGTNGPDAYVLPGFSLHAELQSLVKSGFTPLQALQSATFNPALFLVKLNKFGVVEIGRSADLVLLEGNPLDDISNTRRIAGVVLDGTYYSRPQLDRMLAQVAEIAAQN